MSKITLPIFTGIGAAFILKTPAQENISLSHKNGIVKIRKDASYILINLHEEVDADQIKAISWESIQDCLDTLAVSHRISLVIKSLENEWLTWHTDISGVCLTFHETAISKWSINARGEVRDSLGNLLPPEPIIALPHQRAFRYFRFSLATDNLFDAFRNAYLALEWVIADISPRIEKGKGSESELNWLIRVLIEDSKIFSAFPHNLVSVEMIEKIYRRGRTSLFHGKKNKEHFLPHGPERDLVRSYYKEIHMILQYLLPHVYGRGVRGGWASMSRSSIEESTRKSFEYDTIQFKDKKRLVTLPINLIVRDTPLHFGNLWARITVEIPKTDSKIGKFIFTKDSDEWANVTFPEHLPLKNVSKLIFEIYRVEMNSREPPTVFDM